MSRKVILRIILLTFVTGIIYAITRSFQTGSNTGLILSIVSLAAGIHFFYLLRQLHQQNAAAENEM